MAMALVGPAISAVTKIGEYLFDPVGRQFGYLFFYGRKIQILENQVQKLEDRRATIQLQVEAGTRNTEIVVPEVNRWLKRVEDICDEAKKFLEGEVKANKGCLNGWCPNPKARYSLGRKATKKAAEVTQLYGDGVFHIVCQRGPSPGIESTPTEDIESFDSRKGVMNEVLEALKADGINMIGICGMAGVGKTTLVNEVVKRAIEEKLFDEVVMAVVSQSPDVMKIQGEIADRLDFKFEAESASIRASQLCKRLKMKAKTLVILDDLWQRLKLSDIGIPLGGDGHKSCKIVLTSRSEDVCNQMGTQVKFPIHVLPEEEAWNLFKKMAGISTDERDTTELYSTQRAVVNECGGLPIAIVIVGRALIDKRESSWRDALQQLRSSTVQEIYGRVDSKAFSSLKFSYDWLESEDAKKCFLHCSVFPEDYNIPIEDLVRHGIGLEWFQSIGTVDEVERARDRVHALVDDLKRCYLLLDGWNKKHVKMHDVVRDMAISIASRREENSLMVESEGGLKDWPTKYRNKNYSAIWVSCADMRKLPGNLEFPNLQFLHLQHPFHLEYNGKLPETRGSFYEGMKELKVLASLNMPIPISLPTSLRCLTCTLWGDLYAIGALVNLEILSFTSSRMEEELPREIGHLTHLKLLDLVKCEVKRIPPGVLSRLSKLEELYIGRSGVRTWCVGVEDDKDRDDARNAIAELASLSNLVALAATIHDVKFWPRDWVVKKFDITFGGSSIFLKSIHGNYLLQNQLQFSGLDASDLMESGHKMLLKRTKILQLQNVKGLKNILRELDQDGFENLTELILGSVTDLEYLIDTTNDGVLVPLRAFPALKSLTLKNLFNFKGIICHGRQLPKEAFTALTNLELWAVTITGSLFLLSIARGLKQLETLDISRCWNMEEIVSGEGGEHGIAAAAAYKIEFPKLNILHLEDLPSFTAFCKAINGIELPQLEDLQIYDIPNLRSLCTTISESDTDTIVQPIFFKNKLWKLPTQLVRLSNLRSVYVAGCDKLENLFSISVARGLLQLHTLKVRDCYNLEVIVASEAEHKIVADKIEFPKLKILDLAGLPNFTAFSETMDAIELPHLTNLQLVEIPKLIQPFINKVMLTTEPQAKLRKTKVNLCHRELLNILFPSNLIECMQHLEELAVEGCQSLEVAFDLEGLIVRQDRPAIVLPSLTNVRLSHLSKLTHVWKNNSLGIQGFQNLRSLTVEGCNSLRNLFSSSIAKLLVKLEELEIIACVLMEVIIAKEPRVDDEVTRSTTIFPQLTRLKLSALPNLTSFCHQAYSFKGSFLKKLEVIGCPKMKALPPEFQQSNVGFHEATTSTDQYHLLDGKFILSSTGECTVTGIDEATEIWHNQLLEAKCLNEVRSMWVQCCGKLLSVVSSSLMQRFRNLEQLQVLWCDSLEVIFDLEGFCDEEGTISQLKKLEFKYLPKLRDIWKKCPQETHCFIYLTDLRLERCDSLIYIFTLSTAKLLVNLKNLKIRHCEKIEKIVNREEEKEEEEEEIFPNLRRRLVEFVDLPSLVCFGTHPLEYHVYGFRIEHCPKFTWD